MINCLLVGSGAALGACCRYHLGEVGKRYWQHAFPIVTLFLNVTGSFLLAFLFGQQLSTPVVLFLGTGILGGYTTFSTFNAELLHLWQQQRYKLALSYGVFSYLGSLLAAALGFGIAFIK